MEHLNFKQSFIICSFSVFLCILAVLSNLFSNWFIDIGKIILIPIFFLSLSFLIRYFISINKGFYPVRNIKYNKNLTSLKENIPFSEYYFFLNGLKFETIKVKFVLVKKGNAYTYLSSYKLDNVSSEYILLVSIKPYFVKNSLYNFNYNKIESYILSALQKNKNLRYDILTGKYKILFLTK